jgi:hypothetical protein
VVILDRRSKRQRVSGPDDFLLRPKTSLEGFICSIRNPPLGLEVLVGEVISAKDEI